MTRWSLHSRRAARSASSSMASRRNGLYIGKARHASTTSVTRDTPFKLAIIGAGPSGFYTASRLLSLLPPTSEVGEKLRIDMYDRLPTPYGLVRYGVSPDHPEVKNCQHKFDELAEDSRFRFLGNVNILTDTSKIARQPYHDYDYPCALHLPLSALRSDYTHILFTYGSSLSNTLAVVTGSTSDADGPLGNVYPALAFVSWYNGHPAYAHLAPKLRGIDEATVIGQGNVAIDCARMLLKNPEELAKTDVPESVMEVLRSSTLRRVEAVGRRGPAQAAFTTKEFREMLNLPGVRYSPEALVKETKVEGDRMRKRLLDLMGKSTTGPVARKEFALGFLKSPKAFLGDKEKGVTGIKWSLNNLLSAPEQPPAPLPNPPAAPAVSAPVGAAANVIARPTGEEVETQTGLVIESVGYRAEPLEGVPFEGGKVRNMGGRVVDENGVAIPGLYTAGWVARGPVGVIASTMQNAYAVAQSMIEDLSISTSSTTSSDGEIRPSRVSADDLPKSIRDSTQRIVYMQDWKRIDNAELENGKALGKLREKFTTVEDMLKVIDG